MLRNRKSDQDSIIFVVYDLECVRKRKLRSEENEILRNS